MSPLCPHGVLWTLQGTVFWRARLKVDKVHEKPQWFFGDEK